MVEKCMMFDVTAPATSANLGPGFDCLGAALDINNISRIKVSTSNAYSMVHTLMNINEPCEASKCESVPSGTRDLLIEGCCQVLMLAQLLRPKADDALNKYCNHHTHIDKDQSIKLSKVLESLFQDYNVDLSCDSSTMNKFEIITYLSIPMSRGLGSSTAAYQAGCLIGLCSLTKGHSNNILYGENASRSNQQVLRSEVCNFLTVLCTLVEGHSDNAVACAYGGVQAVLREELKGNEITCLSRSINICSSLYFKLLIPDDKVATSDSRLCLPAVYTKETAFDALRNLLTFLKGLEIGSFEDIRTSWNYEVLHLPYRMKYNVTLRTVIDIIEKEDLSDEISATLSGSGSAILLVGRSSNSFCLLAEVLPNYLRTKLKSVELGGAGIRVDIKEEV